MASLSSAPAPQVLRRKHIQEPHSSDTAQLLSIKKHERQSCAPQSQGLGLREGKDHDATPHRVCAVQVQVLGNCTPEDQAQVNIR